MENNKLISMTDFVMNAFEKWENDNNPDCQSSARYILGTKIYAKFLRQDLTLSMFVPCDDEGNVLEEPEWSEPLSVEEEEVFEHEQYLYEKAKSNVLFEGFEMYSKNEFYHDLTYKKSHFVYDTIENRLITGGSRTNDKTIENIVDAFLVPIELTPTALKQIYG